MELITVESDQITLPVRVVEQLKGKQVEFVPQENGFLLRPVSDPIVEARGFLKNSRFSTKRYLQIKKEEKSLEEDLPTRSHLVCNSPFRFQ